MQEEIKLIGKRIRLLRTAKNLTQTGLAKEMGISQTHLCNIECGRVPVTLPNLLKLHSLLECSMASFFVDLDEQPETKDNDISLDEVLQIVKLLKQKNESTKMIQNKGCVDAYGYWHTFFLCLQKHCFSAPSIL